MSRRNNALEVGETQFLPATLPPLAAGEYKVSVQQRVETPESEPLAHADAEFHVDGPRFTLDPASVFSQHPPPGQVGAFGNELPHIVLNRSTLPWERRIDEKPAGPALSSEDPVPSPWLALLLVDAKDPGAPKVSSGTLGDLLPTDQGGTLPKGILGPTLPNKGNTGSPLNPWESTSDLCNYIDLDAPLYESIIPSLDGLGLLAHVRQINTENTVVDDMQPDGSYAVLVANRLPYSESYYPPVTGLGIQNTVCLVSLEGFLPYLYDDSDKSAHLPEGTEKVRLAVLASWSFWDNGGNNVQKILEDLDVGPLNRLGKPYSGDWIGHPEPTPKDPSPFTSFTEYALTQGYTALNHFTRVGEETVSWFRGPLRPFPTETADPELFESSDAALRYNPDSGMFDVSDAAAWQLGRMLALNNKQFALAVYNYRSASYQSVLRRIAERELRKRAACVLATGPSEKLEPRGVAMRRDFLRWLAQGELYRVVPPGPRAAEVAQAEAKEAGEEVQPHIAEADLAADIRAVLGDSEVPQVISQWLGRLFLLYGVPLHYLVPDAVMLPQESFRYFHYDSIWIERLLDGALSIWRPTERSAIEKLLEEALAGNFKEVAAAEALGVRSRLLKKRGLPTPEVQHQVEPGGYTGFLMRSSLVPGWKGLEVTAFSSTDPKHLGPPTPPLRIDRIAPDIILCVYPGTINQVVVKQPPQGMQFGAAGDPKAGWYKGDLRYLSGDETGMAFKYDGEGGKFVIARRSDDDPRVLSISQIAEDLAEIDKIGLPGPLNSADLAVEMVFSAAYAVFTPKPPESPDPAIGSTK